MNDIARHVVAAVALLLACFIVGALFTFEVPEKNQRLADVAFGVVLGWGTMIIMFHFGSSQGSKDKTALMSHRPTGEPGDPVHTEENQ